MQLIRKANEINKLLSAANKRVGFVPTMGCLHEGHLSLIQKSMSPDDITVCSIFVNPTQFNDQQDFEKYPVTLEKDIEKLASLNCDILFLPSVEEIYPPGLPDKAYAIGSLENVWEGFYRQGHFQGVCKVMDRLLEIIPAHDLWMGQKDFQQCLVIEKLLELTNRQNILLHRIVTVRESSGLALSSRNTRLSTVGKESAKALYEALRMIKVFYQTKNFIRLQEIATDYLLQNGFEKVDYLVICYINQLLPAKEYQAGQEYVVIVAAWIEGVRLIDNLVLQ